MTNFLEFETSLINLQDDIHALESAAPEEINGRDVYGEIEQLKASFQEELVRIYSELTPWQTVQVARHAGRPHGLDFICALIKDFTPLAGDRRFGEDRAIVGGMGRFHGCPVMVVAHEKGSDLHNRLKHNFGMAKPEGYRKTQRLMRLAERYHMPIISFVDTAGAYPGVDSEERGQAEAIAESIRVCLDVQTPFVSVVIGEGGSGGAIALAAADRIIMMQHSVYSVISPEGCASIVWRDGKKAEDAAQALRMTAHDLMELGVIDAIAPEPIGGAHRNPDAAIAEVSRAISQSLAELAGQCGEALVTARRQKFLAMGKKGLEST